MSVICFRLHSFVGLWRDESAPTEETSSGQDSAAVANAQAEEKLEDTLESNLGTGRGN